MHLYKERGAIAQTHITYVFKLNHATLTLFKCKISIGKYLCGILYMCYVFVVIVNKSSLTRFHFYLSSSYSDPLQE